uniref:DUF642 domain-containing protein n=1 Tax=Solibacter usitatus (strain Ellin6076) TaxID=234267 RepID=Q01Y00_SOLUE
MNSINTIGWALTLLASSLVTVDAQAQILRNGGFESPALSVQQAIQECTLTTDIGGWIVGGSPGSVYVIACPNALTLGQFTQMSVNYCDPSERHQYLKLNGQASGANVFQTVTTTPDLIYTLGFSIAAANGAAKGANTIRVTVESGGPGGAPPFLVDQQFAPDRTVKPPVADHPLVWTRKVVTFRARSTQTTITFADSYNAPTKPFTDDVSFIDDVILEVPRTALAPYFVGLVAISVFGLYVIRRIRRSRVQG